MSLGKLNPRVSKENLETVAKSRMKANSILFSLTRSELSPDTGPEYTWRLSVLGMLATVTRHEQGKRESASKGPRDKFGL